MRFRILIATAFLLLLFSRFSLAVLPGFEELLRGDANNDSQVDMADIAYIDSYLFESGPEPSCLDAADANDDGAIDLSDMVYLNDFLFSGGPPPPDPYPYCGDDPTEDDLDCQESACE